MTDQTSHPFVDFLTSKVGIIALWIGNGISTLFSAKVALALTVIATVANLFFTFRDKWWRDPYRKARRAAKRRRR